MNNFFVFRIVEKRLELLRRIKVENDNSIWVPVSARIQ
jgi:hypothetical protein